MAKFTRKDVQQADESRNYPGNPWINRDDPFYDPWTWGANGIDPDSMQVVDAPDGTGIDMDTASRNTPLPGTTGTGEAFAPPLPKPWKQ